MLDIAYVDDRTPIAGVLRMGAYIGSNALEPKDDRTHFSRGFLSAEMIAHLFLRGFHAYYGLLR